MANLRLVLLSGAVPLALACGDSGGVTDPAPPSPCELSLQVGQTSTPGPGTVGCRLRAVAGAEYALALLDTRAILSAATAEERLFGSWSVLVSLDGTAPPLSTSALHGFDDAYPADIPHVHFSELPGALSSVSAAYDRSLPWVMGEQFVVRHPRRGADVAARVVRVYPGGLVAAWVEGEATAHLDAFLEQLDYAVDVLHEYGLPLLQATFASRLPVTSTAANQYLMLLGTDDVRGSVHGVARGDTVLSLMVLNISTTPGEASMASLLAHELTHSYQMMYMRDTRPRGVTSSSAGTSLWAVEGGANLISYEVIRRLAGMPLAGNVDWRHLASTPAAEFYARRAQPAMGEFTSGYDNAMGFLRHLVIQRVRAGDDIAEAVRQVSRGAVEGWHGHDRFGAQRVGLTTRMSQRLGQPWNPVQAMIDWTLSHAADDLTPNVSYQDHASLRIWEIPDSLPVGWRPALTLSASEVRSGSFQRRGGDPHYVYLRDDGDGVGFSISSGMSALEWKLIRTR
jgi:hypothetical protein